MATKLSRGDKVQLGNDGPVMEIMAASERLALCRWQQDGTTREAVLETASLRKATGRNGQAGTSAK